MVYLNSVMSASLPKKKLGQIYLDLLITLAILVILTPALLSLVMSSYLLLSFTRARLTAKHLAQEKIELIRNLPYNQVGTSGGIPAGPLAQFENIVRNGLNYQVYSSVVYIDDPFDETAPNDLLATDYKRTRIEVSWQGMAESARNPVVLVTDIAPRGVESTTGGGTLSILVFDSQSQPVPQAEIKIINNKVTPVINLTLKTNDQGRVMLPGAPACTEGYEVSTTKENYSSDRTYSTQEITHPYKPHLSIIENQLSEVSFAIDKLSELQAKSFELVSHGFILLPGQTFILKGEKVLGTDINDEPVYKFEENFMTDAAGQVKISNLEWDNYHFSLPQGTSWDLAGTNPLLPVKILPDTKPLFSFLLAQHTSNSLLTIFKDAASNPVASVSARLSDAFGFEASRSSGLVNDPDFGQVFFSNLGNYSYLLEATASGFRDLKTTINVSGQTQENIILEAR